MLGLVEGGEKDRGHSVLVYREIDALSVEWGKVMRDDLLWWQAKNLK